MELRERRFDAMRRSEKADNVTDKSIGTVFYFGVIGEQKDNVSNVHKLSLLMLHHLPLN